MKKTMLKIGNILGYTFLLFKFDRFKILKILFWNFLNIGYIK